MAAQPKRKHSKKRTGTRVASKKATIAELKSYTDRNKRNAANVIKKEKVDKKTT